MNEAQLQKLFENAKNAGLPESELDQIYKLLIETKYKAQPRLIKKLLIEHNLNPAPYNTLGECYEKVSNGVMQANDLYIKANITKFIAKFERENGSIVDFGSEVSFEQKINSIYNSLIKYVENEKKEEANTNVQTELD
jgi:hemerythrin-like domain-containing protein